MSYLLGKLEQKVMDVLWDEDNPLKVAEVQSKLEKNYAYTTIMTVLKRLTEKDILERELKGNVYYYCALKCRSDFAENKLKTLFDKIINSYGDLAISGFVDTLDKKDLKLLKDYLEKRDK